MSRAWDLSRRLSQLLDLGVGLIVDVVEAVAFWATIALPFVYLGGYVGTRLIQELSLPSIQVLGALFALNFLALIAGNGYHRTPETAETNPVSTSTGRTQHAD